MKFLTLLLFTLLTIPALAIEAGPANSVLRVPSSGGKATMGAVNLASSNAVTGLLPWTNINQTSAVAGAASAPSLMWTGSPYTGGTGTTTMPMLLMQPSAASASTTWNTNGTFIGINAPSSFSSGNLIDLQNNGTSWFTVDSGGNVTSRGGSYVLGNATAGREGHLTLNDGGTIDLIGGISGDVTITGGGSGAFGTYTFKFPTSGGSAGQFLVTDGTGATSFQSANKYMPTTQVFTSGATFYYTTNVFTVASANATAGATYTNNSVTCTVEQTISAGTLLYAYCTNPTLASGTLTKASGTGDATITFTLVVEPTWIEVMAVGSGGGGAGAGTASGGCTSNAGANTTFGGTILVAGGGQGTTSNAFGAGGGDGSSGASNETAHWAWTGSDGNTGFQGGNSSSSPNGGNGGASCLGGAGGGAQSTGANTGNAGKGNSGGGGGGGSCGYAQSPCYTGGGGGAGACSFGLFVNPTNAYALSIGSGGSGGSACTAGGGGGAGGGGVIVVKEHFGG